MSAKRSARGLDNEQARLRGFARSVADIEWLLLILVVLYLFVVRPDVASSALTLFVLFGFAAFVLVFRYARPYGSRLHVKLTIEIFTMVVFLTAALAVSGGVRSPLVNLYLLPIVTAALALNKRLTAVVIAAVCSCYPLLEFATGGSANLGLDFAIGAVSVLAPFLLVAYATTLLVDNINVARHRIRALSDRDELTGLYNHRAFTEIAEREHETAFRGERQYSVLMIDVEHLQAINDTYGQEAGDRALKLVGEALVRLTRSADVCARAGDDEFCVLLGDASKGVAEEVAQRVRNVVFATTLEVSVKMVRVKVNVGAATFSENGHTLQAVMSAAEKLMYKDKELREPPKGKLIIQKR